jgi:hypothetical protein
MFQWQQAMVNCISMHMALHQTLVLPGGFESCSIKRVHSAYIIALKMERILLYKKRLNNYNKSNILY